MEEKQTLDDQKETYNELLDKEKKDLKYTKDELDRIKTNGSSLQG